MIAVRKRSIRSENSRFLTRVIAINCSDMEDGVMVSLSDGEWKIMNVLWERESTITELKNQLGKETGWDKHIVITMLSRME